MPAELLTAPAATRRSSPRLTRAARCQRLSLAQHPVVEEEVEEVAENVVMKTEGETEVEEESEDEAGVNTTNLASRRGPGDPEKDSYQPRTQHQRA